MAAQHSRRRAAGRGLGFFIAAGLSLALAAPASAVTYLSERYSWSDVWSYDWCGPVIDVTVEGGGLLSIRSGTGKDAGAFFAHDVFWYHEIQVRRSDGKVATVDGSGVFQETKATRVDGTIFEFSSVQAGQPFTVRDADGGLILRDRGAIRDTILFDVGDDAAPGGELIDVLSSTLHGQFPGLTNHFCEYWED